MNKRYSGSKYNLNEVDLVFVVDTTGSMGPFIDAARLQMMSMLESLVTETDISMDLRVAIVEYRDHPPQEDTFITKVHRFSGSLSHAQQTIDNLKPNGGGDSPEAVFDGLQTACDQLEWRSHARRLAILVGDAPPHGTGERGDFFPDGCPCGLTLHQTTAIVEDNNVILFALGLTRSVEESFGQLAILTGGEYFSARKVDAAILSIKNVLLVEFNDLAFDHQVLDHCLNHVDWTIDALCLVLDNPRGRVSASLSRLGRRGLLTGT
jgi:hypothetical protein